MATIAQPFLFSWKAIDEASDLDRLSLILNVLPDEKLVSFLEQRRGKGRNDYPVRATWNALLAGVVFQHKNSAELLRELCRNGELRQLCGFDPFHGANAVPAEWAFSRFLSLVVDNREFITEMFHALIDELKEVLPELGEKTAVDSKAISSFGNPVRDEEKIVCPDGRRDIDADCPSRHSLRSFLRMMRNKVSFSRVIPRRPQAVTRGICSSTPCTNFHWLSASMSHRQAT